MSAALCWQDEEAGGSAELIATLRAEIAGMQVRCKTVR